MRKILVRLTPAEEERARSQFPGSAFQKRIHNFLVGRLNELQLVLETVSTTDLAAKQAELKAVKHLYVHIHAEDSDSTKEIYEIRDIVIGA